MGMAFCLGPEDHIFGSHRSHGEILAKGFSAIRKLERRRSCWRSCGRIATARCCVRWRRATAATCRGSRVALLRLRRVQRDLRAGDGLQSRARRLDARLLRAVRHLSE